MSATSSEDADHATKALFLGVAPERQSDILRLFDSVEYKQVSDRPALHLEAASFFGRGAVVFTGRTMQQIWLISYLAWQTLIEQVGFIAVSLSKQLPYRTSEFPHNDKYITRVDRLAQALGQLRDAQGGSMPWPPDVPKLDPTLSELRSVEDRAAHQLACFAAAFVLLHETAHAIKRTQGDEYGGVDEELSCDLFAIRFLLDGVAQYSKESGESEAAVYQKRAMGVFLGLAVTFESTEMGLWLPSDSHPSACERITQLVQVVEPHVTEPNHHFWILATSVLLSKARRSDQLPATIEFESTRALFDRVLKLMWR